MARLDYFAPGVYIEEHVSSKRPISGASTAIAGFLGFTEAIRGDAALFRPILINSWNDYLEFFAEEDSDGFTDFDAYLPFAVYGWFLNGGGRCWVMSIGTQIPGTNTSTQHELKLPVQGNNLSLRFSLKLEDYEGLKISAFESKPRSSSNDEEQNSVERNAFFKIVISRNNEELEQFDNLSVEPDINPEVGTYALAALQESELIMVHDITRTKQLAAPLSSSNQFEIIPSLLVPRQNRFSSSLQGMRDERTGIQGLYEIDEITVVAAPDLMKAYEVGLLDRDQLHGMMELQISLCETAYPNPNRMVVLDPPPESTHPRQVTDWLLREFNRRSMFAALYYPWIEVPNPRSGKPILVPPCGHVMGVWSRTDELNGVWQAPANELLWGLTGLAYNVNLREHELLNPLGINCIRLLLNQEIRILGSRTLVEPDRIEWRYINVRRLVNYVTQSISLGVYQTAFGQNNQSLRDQLKKEISGFLEQLWRKGALIGESFSDAFYVRCDEELNPPEIVSLGRVYVEVGICPVRPKDFVVFRVDTELTDPY